MRLANIFPPTIMSQYHFLDTIDSIIKRVLFLADKMPCVFAEALSGVAEGETITSAGLYKVLEAFIVTIDRDYFPLYIDWALEDGILSHEIPVIVFGIGNDDLDGGYDTLTALYFAVYANNLVYTPGDIFLPFDDTIAEIFPVDETDEGNVRRIRARLQALPVGHPARGALATLRLIERDEGNLFLDCSYTDQTNDTCWDDFYFDMLTEAWQLAKPVVDAHFEFMTWLSEGLYGREEAFIRYIGGLTDELDQNIYAKKEALA